MKNALLGPPPIITVAVLTSASPTLGRRKSRSLKRSLSPRASSQSNPTSPLASPHALSTPSSPTASASGSVSSNGDVVLPPAAPLDVVRSISDPGPSPPSLMTPSSRTEPLVATASDVATSAVARAAASSSPASSDRGLMRAKGDSERELVVRVPLAIAYLEQVKLEFSVLKQHADVRYVLTVHHAKLNVKWRRARPFAEYRKLQQRLLKLLQLGHFCSADCPWMFTFLKSYFPKKHLFNFVTARVVETRKAALERLFMTTQSFLLNRANHGCGFLTAAFADELVAFIYGDMITQYPLEQLSNAQPSTLGSIESSGSNSSAGGAAAAAVSLAWRQHRGFADSGSDNDESSCCSSSAADAAVCQICDSSLYGEAFASKKSSVVVDDSGSSTPLSSSIASETLELDMVVASLAASVGVLTMSPTSSSTSSLNSSASGRRATHYVTTLECGHQFHDECVVPKLNETLRCPTCGYLEVK